MAQTRSTGATRAEKLDSGTKAKVAEQTAAEPKPRRRITRRKALENHVRSYIDALGRRAADPSRSTGGEHEAAVELHRSGHFTGQALQGVEPTGTRVEWRGMDLIEVADDGMSFARQIGLIPTPGSAPEWAMKGAFNAATKLRRAMAARTSGR